MSPFKIAAVFSISLIIGGIGNICHGLSFRSDMLSHMARYLPVELPETDSVMVVKYGDRDVVVRVAGNCVEHIGYRIFPDGFREGDVDPKIADFVERYWLWLNLPMERPRTVGQQLTEDRFQFLKGGLSSIEILQKDDELPFSCDIGPGYIKMAWGENERPACVIGFPVNHELILGRRMLENDRRLPDEITSVAVEELPAMKPVNLPSDSVTTIMVDNAGSYLDVALKSERYYVAGTDGDTSPIPVFTPELPVESVMNLFTGYDIDKAANIKLNINHKIFGFKEQAIETTIPQFVGYSIKNNCEAYAGIISLDEGTDGIADILVIMRNRQLGYNHILRVSLPLESLATGEGTATARLNAFVPSSNIKNLFKD